MKKCTTTNNPFEDDIFIKIMDGILEQSHNKLNVILCAMEMIDKKKDPITYYTLDCALCYHTYKNMPKTKTVEHSVKKLIKRIHQNIDTMKIKDNNES